MQLNFIQSNWLRQYPFRADHGILDLNNVIVPIDLIVGLKLTCKVSDLEVFIDKIYTNKGQVGISFSGSDGTIGYANGIITDDNQYLSIKDYNGGILGNVMIGNSETTELINTFIFDNTNGLVEPSTIMPLPVPAVSSIKIKNTTLTGNVTINSTSLNITTTTDIAIEVSDPGSIASRGDKKAAYLTCDNSVISGINSVTPDKNGNIDIYAIQPLEIGVATVNGVTQLQLSTPDMGLNEVGTEVGNLCILINNPPANNSDVYGIAVSSMTKTTEPEFDGWPQYEG